MADTKITLKEAADLVHRAVCGHHDRVRSVEQTRIDRVSTLEGESVIVTLKKGKVQRDFVFKVKALGKERPLG